MRSLFFNEFGRLRSGWRALVFLLIFLFTVSIFIFGAMTVLAQLPIGPSAGSYLPMVVPFALSAAAAIVLGWFCGRLFEDVPFRALGVSFRARWFKNLLIGCVVGMVAMVSAVIIGIMSGGLSFSINRGSAPGAVSNTLLTTFVIFFVGAVSEETLFRGYLLQTFTRARSAAIGVGLTSLLFAFAHNGNPDVSKLALLNTFVAGVWFAAAYLKTRDIWFPLGIHLMWNWLQGPVFGINVSGIGEFSPDPLLRAADVGPAWLTGGSYGIEGGIACTIALLISMAIIYYLPGVAADEEMLVLTSTETMARADA